MRCHGLAMSYKPWRLWTRKVVRHAQDLVKRKASRAYDRAAHGIENQAKGMVGMASGHGMQGRHIGRILESMSFIVGKACRHGYHAKHGLQG